MRINELGTGKLVLLACVAVAMMCVSGCKPGEVIDISKMTPEQRAEIIGLTIPQDSIKVAIGRTTEVTFAVTDAYGTPVVGIETLIAEDDRFVRFTLVKLVAGTNGDPDSWFSYIREEGVPTYDSPRQGGMLTANRDNTYTYTFAYDVEADAAFERTVTHRLGGQMGNARITSKNHPLISIDQDKNLLVIKGTVPGPAGGYCVVETAKKPQ